MKRKLCFLCLVLVFCLIAGACGSAAQIGGKSVRTDEANGYSINEKGSEDAKKQVSENSIKDIETRKLIKDVELIIETKEFDKFISNIEKETNSCSGYVQKSDISGSSDYDSHRYAMMVVRIPADKLNSFTSQVSSLATVRSKEESVQDVTMDYVDIESHIKALKAEEESLLALLKKAESLNDILSIQKALTDVRYQLESYESKLRTYDNLIAYSTVTMEIYEVERETPKDISMWQEIWNNLSENISTIGDASRSIFIWFVSSSPYFLILAVIVIAILLIVRISVKRSEKRNSKNYNNTNIGPQS